MLLTWAILLTILCLLCVGLAAAATSGDSFALTAMFGFGYVILGNAAGVFWLLYLGVNIVEWLAEQGYIG